MSADSFYNIYNFYSEGLDMRLCAADAYCSGTGVRAYLEMSQEACDFLQTYGGIYQENEHLRYKGHTVIITNELRSNRTIRIVTPDEDIYYSWWC